MGTIRIWDHEGTSAPNSLPRSGTVEGERLQFARGPGILIKHQKGRVSYLTKAESVKARRDDEQ